MSTFEPEWPGLPTEDQISEYLANAGCDDLAHPYDTVPARPKRRIPWRGGPPLDPNSERAYFDEQDDQ